jgi:hypothetical protein
MFGMLKGIKRASPKKFPSLFAFPLTHYEILLSQSLASLDLSSCQPSFVSPFTTPSTAMAKKWSSKTVPVMKLPTLRLR